VVHAMLSRRLSSVITNFVRTLSQIGLPVQPATSDFWKDGLSVRAHSKRAFLLLVL